MFLVLVFLFSKFPKEVKKIHLLRISYIQLQKVNWKRTMELKAERKSKAGKKRKLGIAGNKAVYVYAI